MSGSLSSSHGDDMPYGDSHAPLARGTHEASSVVKIYGKHTDACLTVEVGHSIVAGSDAIIELARCEAGVDPEDFRYGEVLR